MKRRGTGRSSDTQETLKETEFFITETKSRKKNWKKNWLSKLKQDENQYSQMKAIMSVSGTSV